MFTIKMKKPYLLIIFLLFSLSTFGQTYTTVFSPQKVVSQRLISLNGGLRASAGGKSRTTIQVNLPKGTKEWYYSFSTNPAGSGVKNLQLLMQLASAVSDPTKISSLALSKLEIPSGSKTIDIYLLDELNADAFIKKVDNNGGSFNFSREGSLTATRQGLVKISRATSQPMYIGIKNPSSLEGVDVTIEVVAVVQSKQYDDSWTTEHLDDLYNYCLSTYINGDSKIESICACVKEKILNQYKPSTFDQLSESSQQSFIKNEASNCASETGNINVIENEKRNRELLVLLQGQGITKDYAGVEKTLKELTGNGVNSWQLYNSLGFSQLCLGKYDEAIKSLQIGLGKNPKDLYLLGNLANYYLLTNRYDEAIKIFDEYKNKKLSDKRKFKIAVSEDLKEFERLGLKNQDFDRVRKELRIQ